MVAERSARCSSTRTTSPGSKARRPRASSPGGASLHPAAGRLADMRSRPMTGLTLHRALRPRGAAGLPVGTGQIMTAVRGSRRSASTPQGLLRHAPCLFVTRPSTHRFAEVFRLFWRDPRSRTGCACCCRSRAARNRPSRGRRSRVGRGAPQQTPATTPSSAAETRCGRSPLHLLRRGAPAPARFRQMTRTERAAARRAIPPAAAGAHAAQPACPAGSRGRDRRWRGPCGRFARGDIVRLTRAPAARNGPTSWSSATSPARCRPTRACCCTSFAPPPTRRGRVGRRPRLHSSGRGSPTSPAQLRQRDADAASRRRPRGAGLGGRDAHRRVARRLQPRLVAAGAGAGGGGRC